MVPLARSTSVRSLAVLIALASLILLGRVRLYSAPLHGDICAYALIGHEMLGGRPLYTDLWERKPPLLYATFAAAEKVVGYGRGEILLVNVAAAWATLAGVTVAGRGGGAGWAGGLFAAGLWALLSADLPMTANQPDPEVFINACLAGAVAVLVHWPARRSRRRVATAALGVLLAAATLYKHNAALACVALLVGHVGANRRRGQRGVWTAMVESSAAGTVVVLAWAVLLGHARVTGRLPATLDVLFRQNLAYSGGTPVQNLAAALGWARLFPDFMVWAIGPAVLVVAYVGVERSRRRRAGQPPVLTRRWWIWLAWAAGTWATVAVTGKIYAHYYELWLPVACVAGGWAAAELWRAVPAGTGARRAAVAGVLVALAIREGGQFLLPPAEWVRRQFPYYDVAAQNEFGRRMGTFLQPSESFWELGEDNNLYFLSRHSPPSGLLYIDPLIYGSDTPGYWRRLLADLDRRPPDLVVLSTDWEKFFTPAAPVYPWLAAHYDPWVQTTVNRTTYTLLVRRGGSLQRRLRATSPRQANANSNGSRNTPSPKVR